MQPLWKAALRQLSVAFHPPPYNTKPAASRLFSLGGISLLSASGTHSAHKDYEYRMKVGLPAREIDILTMYGNGRILVVEQ